MPKKLHPDNQKVVDLGLAMFGVRWHSDFARMIGFSRPYVSLIASGDRRVTPAFNKAVVEGLKKASPAARRRAYDAVAMLTNEELFK
jgi:hypothetical protein